MPRMSETSPPHATGDEFDPRARIVDRNGNVTPVRRDALVGLDQFIEKWEHNTELPRPMTFSGWQMSDDEHPSGSGKPGYRIVHKTIRTVALPMVSMTYANLQVSLRNGPVTWGEPRFDGALPAREGGSFLLPEWGALKASGDEVKYRWQPNVEMKMEAHQETTPDANYLEILYVLPDGRWEGYEDMVTSGRAGVSTLTMMLDFMFGERLVGPVLTEEVGELFGDWHWNRLIGGRKLAMESQARLDIIDGNTFNARLSAAIERHLGNEEGERNRVRVAAQWYWRAESEQDLVQRYISYWLCVEALELGQNDKLWKVKEALASLLGVEKADVSSAVGRIYGVRNGLVHGDMREVDVERVERVRAVAVALLESHSLGAVTVFTRAGLRWALDQQG